MVLSFVALIVIGATQIDPLLIIAITVMAYYARKGYVLNQMRASLDYWKSEEIRLKQAQREAVTADRDRRLRTRELRAKRVQRTRTYAKELKAIEHVLKPEDRATLKMLPKEDREREIKAYGLDVPTVEKWLAMTDAELERKKMGLD